MEQNSTWEIENCDKNKMFLFFILIKTRVLKRIQFRISKLIGLHSTFTDKIKFSHK